MKATFSRQVGKQGFTLAEILCALAVLSILVLMIAQLMGGAAKTMNSNENRIDVEGQVRTAFASMSDDFTNMIKKSDVDIFFSKIAGVTMPDNNDALYFYTQAESVPDANGPPANDETPFSVVGYQVLSYSSTYNNTTEQLYHLVRYSRPLTWDNTGAAGPVFYTYAGAAGIPGFSFHVPDSKLAPPDVTSTLHGNGLFGVDIPYSDKSDLSKYHVIADGIFRLEYCFLHSDGSFSDTPVLPPPALAPKGWVPVNTPANDLSNVVAIVMTVAELDPASQRQVPSMQDLVSDFPDSALPEPGSTPAPDSSERPTLMATNWQKVVDTIAQTGADQQGDKIPKPVAAKIRIYQHFFYLNND